VGGVVGALGIIFLVRRLSRRRSRDAVTAFGVGPKYNKQYDTQLMTTEPQQQQRGSESGFSHATAATNPSFMSSSAFSQQAPAGTVPYVQPVFVPGLGMLQPSTFLLLLWPPRALTALARGAVPQFAPRNQEATPSYRRPQSSVVLNRERYSTLSNTPSVQSGLPVVTVMHPFDAENEDELTVQANDRLQIIQVVDGNEWAVCRRTTNGEIGLVPVNFLGSFS